jgi:isopentenyl phosphate kinase
MKDLILLKIGGSVCTHKSTGKFRVRTDAVAKIAREIAEARKERDFRLLVVNGAGAFGHANVVEYDINDGLTKARDFEGFVKTIGDCNRLNLMISDIMRRKGLPAYPYPTSSVVIQSAKKITAFWMDGIKAIWGSNEDIIPVMNGDMVPDTRIKGSVLSGDGVIEHMAARMAVKRIVFATDVDGVFTGDPRKEKRARLIREVTKDNFERIRHGISGSSNTDVTGGMLGKVRRFLGMGTVTVIVNGNRPGRVRDAILGKAVKGTIIKS